LGVARNHPLADGNKRTAWVLARLFLALNGQAIAYPREHAVRTLLALAAGTLDEAALADWLRAHRAV
jgi:death-on-curing protein